MPSAASWACNITVFATAQRGIGSSSKCTCCSRTPWPSARHIGWRRCWKNACRLNSAYRRKSSRIWNRRRTTRPCIRRNTTRESRSETSYGTWVSQIVPPVTRFGNYGDGTQAGRHHRELRHAWRRGGARSRRSGCTGGHCGGWNRLAGCQLLGLWLHAGAGLCLLYSVSLPGPNSCASRPANHRSFRNLSTDRRNLYSIRPGVAARAVGMASVRHCMELCHTWNYLQEFCDRTIRHRVGRGVSGNGLAGRVRDAPFTARSHVARHVLDWAGWPVLYRGHRLLRSRPSVLLSCVLASLCAGRKYLSLLRRAVLRCPTAQLTRKGLAAARRQLSLLFCCWLSVRTHE